MMRGTMKRVLLLSAVCLAGCPEVGRGPAENSPPAKADPAPAKADSPTQADTPPSKADPAPAKADAPADASLGSVLEDAPLPLASMLGADPKTAESHLGPVQGKGGQRKSCVRFVPDRAFFECAHAWQRYADKTGHFETIEMLYEDGQAASIVFEGLRGDDAFSPEAALQKVGLKLPGKPTESAPTEEVKRWSWFNSEARLLIGGRQYRVEVSNIGGDWDKTRVDVILNDPLTDAQKAKILATPAADGNGGGAEGSPE